MKESRAEAFISFERFFTHPMAKAAGISEGRLMGEREERIAQSLSVYPLLNDIPFVYLVPHESMLPDGQIRFFYLDYNWVCAFLDGMCSLGRSGDIDLTHDERLIRGIYSSAVSASGKVRAALQGTGGPQPDVTMDSVCTGFVMRSPLVRGWRGLEFKAYSDRQGEKEALPLRIEALSSDVLFALFEGVVARVDIGEPPEGLHYGFVSQSNRSPGVPIRSTDDGLSKDQMLNISTDGMRVVDVEDLARKMSAALGVARADMTSAHMALELLRTAERIEIIASHPPEVER